MLGPTDRFVFDRGQCSFRDRHDALIPLNGCQLWHRPMAHISSIMAMLIAEQLQLVTGCELEPEFGESRSAQFTFSFKKPPQPQRVARPTMSVISRESINAAYVRARLNEPSSITEAINHHGAEAVAWMLKALFGTDFNFNLTQADGVIWTPTRSAR